MRNAILILCLVVVLFMAACQKSVPAMQILTEEYPPISFASGDSVSGYATDVVRAMQTKLGSSDPITLTKWDEAYNKALKTENVMLFSMEQTPQRKDLFHWIGPLGDNASSFYVRKDSQLSLANPDEAKKLQGVATTASWFTEQFLKDNGFTNLISTSTPQENIALVMDGKAEATILTNLTAASIITDAGYAADDLKPILEVMKTKYYIAISKATPTKTVEKWQKAFGELSADGSLEKLRSKWFK